jgi:hypothetical protein
MWGDEDPDLNKGPRRPTYALRLARLLPERF